MKINIKEKGITLLALVITIIILIILAGITIGSLFGKDKIFMKEKEAGKNYVNSSNEEKEAISNLINEMNQIEESIKEKETPKTDGSWDDEKEVNSPNIDDTGMEEVVIDENGQIKEDGDFDYEYKEDEKHWANAITKDGSMWVWIPRYAYKITYNNSSDKSQGGTIDIVFLKDNTNLDKDGKDVTDINYQDKEGNIGPYTVHPAFQNGGPTGKNNGYSNGEWNREIEGFWVAKFEAGYPEGNNDVQKVSTGLTYGSNNATSNFYGEIVPNNTIMYYPIFIPKTYSYNNIIISDMYKLCKNLSQEGNPYGLKTQKVDSHMMKNSEWGAIAYLTHSKYGRNKEEITINNVNLNNTIPTINAVTGMAAESVNSQQNITTIEAINNGTSGSYSWETEQGKKASSTGTIYGIYDLNGGMYEYTAGYIYNENDSLETYGYNLIHDGPVNQSTEYKTVYAISASDIHTDNYNQSSNINRKGEAIWETSMDGKGTTSWNMDYSVFPNRQYPFLRRGGYYGDKDSAGLFNFSGSGGGSGFRPILIVEQ